MAGATDDRGLRTQVYLHREVDRELIRFLGADELSPARRGDRLMNLAYVGMATLVGAKLDPRVGESIRDAMLTILELAKAGQTIALPIEMHAASTNTQSAVNPVDGQARKANQAALRTPELHANEQGADALRDELPSYVVSPRRPISTAPVKSGQVDAVAPSAQPSAVPIRTSDSAEVEDQSSASGRTALAKAMLRRSGGTAR